MADSKFQEKLDSLLDIQVVRKNDFVMYICTLNELTELLERENGFPVYAGVVKNWIRGFRTIFSENKTGSNAQSFWQTFMSKFCANVTKQFLTLLQCFHQFEPNYTQEFYIHWKTVLSRMNGSKRAESFQTHIDKFKTLIQHLRTAVQRCEQFAILSVLRLYIECVPITDLTKLKEHDNAQIVDLLIKLVENPTILNQHAFLHDVDALGHCIESMKPKKIICKKMKIDMDDSKYEMWLDFNNTDKSIVFSTVSVADCDNQTFGIASRVKLRENVQDDHLLEVNGLWNVISIDNSEPIEKKVTFKFFLLNRTEQTISTLVKNTFRFVNPTVATTGHSSQVPDQFQNALYERAVQLDASPEAVIPPELIPLAGSDTRFPLLAPSKSTLNSIAIEQPKNDRDNYDEISMDIEPNVQPVNRTYIEDFAHSMESNRLADVRLSFLFRDEMYLAETNKSDQNSEKDIPNEVVEPQSVDAYTRSRKKIEIIENITIVPQPAATRIETRTPMLHSPSKGHTKFLQFSQTDERISLNRKAAFNVYSQPTTASEKFCVKDLPSEALRNIQSNESVRLPSQKAIEASPAILHMGMVDHQLDGSMESISRRPLVAPYEHTTANMSTEGTQQTQTVSKCPIEFSSQSPYGVFVPIATSTQQSDKLRKSSDLQQTSQLSQDRVAKTNSSVDMASSLMKSNKASSQATELLPQANRSCETSQTIDKQIEIDAGIKSSSVHISQNSLREQAATRIEPPKRTKCIAIVDLHMMAQSHSRSVIGSQREQKLSQKARASTQNSYREQAVQSLEKHHDRVPPRANAKSTPTLLNLSRKRTKLSQSQAQSASEENLKVSEAVPNETSAQTSSHKEDASSIQQHTDHLDSSRETPKRIKLSEQPMTRSASAAQSVQMSEATATASPQSFDNVTIIDHLPSAGMDSSLNVSRKRKMSASPVDSPTTIVVSQCEPVSFANPKITAVAPIQTVAQKIAPEKKVQSVQLKPSTIKKMSTTRQSPQAEIKSVPRYSSPKSVVSYKGRLQKSFRIADVGDEYEVTDNIRVDEHGTVYDDKGCVFASNDELQRAAKFYLANDGLNYFKRDDTKGLPPSKREKYQRKLRTIQRMIDRGLDELRKKETKINDINPYARTLEDDTIQRESRKRRIKEVSVTLSEKRTIVDSAKNVTVARRTSKLFYIVDEGTSSSSTSPHPAVSDKKTMSKGKQFFSKTKTAQTVKTPQPSTVNLTAEKNGNAQMETSSAKRPADPSSKCDQPSMREDRITPIYASSKMRAKQQQHQKDVASTSAVKIRPPIYASAKMVEAHQEKGKLNPPTQASDELPSHILASVSTDCPTIIDDLSGNIPEVFGPRQYEIEPELCSTRTCNNNLQALMIHLNKIAHYQGSGEQNENKLETFINRFRPNPTIFNCMQLLNGLLNSLESMCENADRVQSVEEAANNALSKFDCPDFANLPSNKCYFQGREFDVNHSIEGDFPHCWGRNCGCRQRNNETAAYIDCVFLQDGCAEDWAIERDWSCVQTYKLNQCCRSDEICGRAIQELSTCVVDGQLYHSGQRITPKDDCYECICGDGYNNETSLAENEHCVAKKCGFGVNLQMLRDECVPIFYPDRCCTIYNYKCPAKTDSIDISSAFATNENHTCSFGALSLKIGDTLKTKESCLTCRCSTPPFITCIRWGEC